MLQLLRDNVNRTKILPSDQFFRDFTWFNVFLKQYNVVTFHNHLTCNTEIHLNASLTGLGAIFDNVVYSLPIDRNYMGHNIVQLEILNILVACKVWAAIGPINALKYGVTIWQ